MCNHRQTVARSGLVDQLNKRIGRGKLKLTPLFGVISRKQPKKHGNAKKPAANYEQAKVRNCTRVAVLCPVSELHDPVDSQSQLECISPPVGIVTLNQQNTRKLIQCENFNVYGTSPHIIHTYVAKYMHTAYEVDALAS